MRAMDGPSIFIGKGVGCYGFAVHSFYSNPCIIVLYACNLIGILGLPKSMFLRIAYFRRYPNPKCVATFSLATGRSINQRIYCEQVLFRDHVRRRRRSENRSVVLRFSSVCLY